MWNDYFYQIQNKYSMRVSTKTPLVIRLDGKNVTKSKNISLIDFNDGKFANSLEKTAEYFTKKYSCYAIFGTDEISFIFPNPYTLIYDLDSSTTHSNEIISLFAQYFYSHFNNIYKGEDTYFHAKCFSIPEGKIFSYLKYRSQSIKNVFLTYILKHSGIPVANLNLKQTIEKCENIPEYAELKQYENGITYYCGNKINTLDALNGNIQSETPPTENIQNFNIEF